MEELIKLIKDLKDDYKLIAPHVRHVIEHYRALIHCHLTTNYEMSYEKKKRDFGLEKEAHYAIHALRGIDNMSKMIDRFRTVQVDGMKSTLGRELGYCQDHQVHHEALIRTILNNNGKEDLIGKTSESRSRPSLIVMMLLSLVSWTFLFMTIPLLIRKLTTKKKQIDE